MRIRFGFFRIHSCPYSRCAKVPCVIGSGTFACLRQTCGGRSQGFQSTAVAVHGPVSTSCACPCVCTLPHVSPVRAPENRKMNRSKNQCSTTTEIQSRVERVCQESKRTTTTTEPESDESLISTGSLINNGNPSSIKCNNGNNYGY